MALVLRDLLNKFDVSGIRRLLTFIFDPAKILEDKISLEDINKMNHSYQRLAKESKI